MPAAPACNRVVTGTFAGESGIAGTVSRLYLSIYNREPDVPGHTFWVDSIEDGSWSVDRTASHFVSSDEFADAYGSLSSDEFIDQLYNNVMCRNADAGGQDFWLDQMAKGMSRPRVVLLFSESLEFKRITATS